MATYDLTVTIPSKIVDGDILNCPYSGSVKSIKLPKGKYKLECWGAQGGYRSSASYAGKGGYSVGTITLSDKSTTLYLYAGGSGNTGGTAGGFNGGGLRYSYPGGGGASDIRIGTDSLYARVIVAGGGGSDGQASRGGGAGGGATGQATVSASYGTNNGPGNTTYSGSSASTTAASRPSAISGNSTAIYGGFGFGGNGQYYASGYGGAGGGGWYGGSGTYPDGSGDDDRGGSGGSGYVYTSATASQYPSGCLLNSSYYLESASTTIGTSAFIDPDTGSSTTGRAGNGYVRITVIEVAALTLGYIKLGNTWKEISGAYKKVNGIWTALENVKHLFFGGTVEKKYVDYSSPGMADTTFLAINGLNDIQKANGYSGGIVTNSGVTESTDVPSNTSFTKSLYFNGNSFITFTNYDFAANDFTIEWWEKPTSDTAGTRFMSTYGTGGGTEAGMMIGWWCTTDLMPEIKWTSYDSYSSWNVIGHGISAGNTDTTGWHHMAYIRSGSNLYVVKDSELVSTQNISTNEVGCNISLPMCFGRRGSDTPNSTCYSGYLCGIRLSKSALYTQFGTYEENVPSDDPPKYRYRAVYNKYTVGSLLPSGYTPVEYIECSGSQYIDTKYVPTATTKIKCDFAYTNLTTQYSGSYISNAFLAFGINNNHELYYGNKYVSGVTATTDRTTIVIDGANRMASIGNDTYSFSDATFTASTYSILLFVLKRSASSITNYCYMKLYGYQIYDNDTLVRDYIPCKNSSGTIGLYDIVNSTFYSNAGSGTFIAGTELENVAAGEFIEQVKVNNSTTYPDGGVLDGYYYEKIL